MLLTRFGSDLLSHVLRRSTISATALNGWVRNGTRCFARAMTTKPRKKHQLQTPPGGDANSYPSQDDSVSYGVYDFGLAELRLTSLLLDQIKPIGQLVPVN